MNQDFSGRVVAVSGGARGIGEAIVREFLSRGAKVIALDRLWDDQLPIYRELQGNANALALSCDITVDEDVARAFDAAMGRFETIDVLVNNAALRQRDLYPDSGASTVLGTRNEHWDRMFAVNCTGTLRLTRAFVEPMISQKRGSVINISANGSVTIKEGDGVFSGNHPHMMNQPYDASKAALTSMSFYLAHELKGDNVAVNVVFPGSTRTTGSEDMTKEREKIGIAKPLADPSHVLPVITYLAGQTGASLTGRAFDAVTWKRG
jgi:NAD(P)-dependent dehydrogenase (short-subunit alcohol dehydrogenase family)